MLASPYYMYGSLAFNCMLLCKGALCKFSIVLLMPLHQLKAGYALSCSEKAVVHATMHAA